jgi:hypothetical protein
MTPVPEPAAASGLLSAALIVAILGQPAGLAAQSDLPSADEVREALQTLRRLERALATESAPPAGSSLARAEAWREGDGLGWDALSSGTLGAGSSPLAVVAPSSFALSLAGDVNLGGSVFRDFTPFVHTTGGAVAANTAVGLNALANVTVDAGEGSGNTAFGYRALRSNTSGFRNTAIGHRALAYNVEGVHNTAVGDQALLVGTGNFNTAVGYRALRNTSTGGLNTAIGWSAGFYWTAGFDNIAIGRGAYGNAQDSGVIRIGGNDFQSETFIEGISDGFVDGDPVCVTSSDELGKCSGSSPTASSSAGFTRLVSATDWREETERLRDEIEALRLRVAQLERERAGVR